ncbi:MAG TPA: lyase family protein [Baekduia sp.]|uniref:lyase family protein n=1 Tax=Baekduia sp. TaxID=2600305 RepID=UPI002D78BFE6|nr:lyase family protein [Baekduia sp.]HET6506466.1 lyase family protein [Baekduia sp.]
MATNSTSTTAAAEPASDALLGPVFARGEAAAAVADRPFLQALLDVEASYARARAGLGLIPAEHAEAIAAACDAARYDVAALGRETARHATPVIGLVAALRAEVGEDVAPSVHAGLTSQDVVDTALMLCAHRALGPLLDDAAAAADGAALLAAGQRLTPILGRTLLQPALPTTFGAKAAGWLTALDEAALELARVRRTVPAAQVGGAVGDRSTLGEHATALATTMADDLGLCHPTLPWHGDRRRPAQLASALAVLAGTCAKVAKDVVLLAQVEVGEARESTQDGEGARGGSSAMAHKANPVSAVSAAACAARAPGLAATMLSVMDGEHERAAGGWQAEWETLRALIAATGSAVAWTCDLLERLEVDPARMRANLDAALGDDLDLRATEAAAGALVDRALAAHRARREDRA